MTISHTKKYSLKAAIGLVLGVATIDPQMASAVAVIDGTYRMTIVANTAPSYALAGTDGAWNSSFTLSCYPGSTGCGSVPMTDNGTNVVYVSGSAAGTAFGSGVGGDGVAGTINMTIVNDVVTNVSSFHVDLFKYTVFGHFAQYASSTALMGGSTSGGVMTFDPTGRLGASSAYDTLYDKPWNEQPAASTWNTFTTGAATAAGCQASITQPSCTIHGASLTGSAGNYSAVLVSAGNIGSNWASLAGIPYFETWKINLTLVPVPASAWLFGSGLLGLVGVAGRKKA